MKKDLFGLTVEQLKEVLAPLELPVYRAKQIAAWMYERYVQDFDLMTDISKTERELLKKSFFISGAVLKALQESKDGKTIKFLLELKDSLVVETVLMRQPYGNSVCVSTQVGCAMGCVFCASTIEGLVRNLNVAEILAQVYFVNRYLQDKNAKVTNIVIMGSGEPLTNYENVLGFIKLCHQKYCMNIGYRNITLSTSGIVPQIYHLAKENIPITLAVSLHAPNNTLRSKLMPINKHYHIEEVIEAADYYAEVTGRRVTYEYILIDGVNESPECAKQLSRLLKGKLANVNIIPINPVVEKKLMRPSQESIEIFADILTRNNINVTVRREMGTDIQAACGQLRYKVLKQQKGSF